jgi:hypothetical protein
VERYHAPSIPRVRVALAALVVAAMLAACSGEAPLPGDPLRLATSSLSDPVLGEPYRQEIVAVGGLRPYRLRIDDGDLPPGLSLQGGLLLGTPTELGRYAFVVAVSDGSLASTFERFALTVRDLPVPRVTIAVPDTEVRDAVVLRGRVEDAASLRALRLRLVWQDDALRPADVAVRASRDDVALFQRAEEDALAIDLAFLGDAFDGSAELFRIELSVSEPTRIGMDLEVETLYAGRHAYDERRLGVPPSPGAGPDAGPGGADAATGEEAGEAGGVGSEGAP